MNLTNFANPKIRGIITELCSLIIMFFSVFFLTRLSIYTFKKVNLDISNVSVAINPRVTEMNIQESEMLTENELQTFLKSVDQFEDLCISIKLDQNRMTKRIGEFHNQVDKAEQEFSILKDQAEKCKTYDGTVSPTLARAEKGQLNVDELQEPLLERSNLVLARLNRLISSISNNLDIVKKNFEPIRERQYVSQQSQILLREKISQQNLKMSGLYEISQELENEMNLKADRSLLDQAINDSNSLALDTNLQDSTVPTLKAKLEVLADKIIQEKWQSHEFGVDCASIENVDEIFHKAIEEENEKNSMKDYASIAESKILAHSRTYVPSINEHLSKHSVASTLQSFFDMNRGVHGQPREALTDGTELGACWAMDGSSGFLTVEFQSPIFIEAVTLEHIRPSLTPDFSSAPRDFRIIGHHLGLKYDDIKADYHSGDIIMQQSFNVHSKNSRQTFTVSNSESAKRMYSAVTFEVLSNHGSSSFTCIYRFKVHGSPDEHR